MRRQKRAHRVDAVSHAIEFLNPGRTQRRVRKYMRSDRRSVIWRHRIDAPGDLQHMALHRLRARVVLADGD